MKPPCMTIVKHVLPAVRALIAKDLTEKHGLRKINAAKKLGLSPAALTQYQKGLRGRGFTEKILQSKNAMELITETAEALANGEAASSESVMVKLCQICRTLRKEGIVCATHYKEFPELEGVGCTVCKKQ
ncbi:transcriptional regulator [Candidatus Bathyarchaeota archaeon]|nr:MAG: transcriptional regulator [Candidatus Bathyarchaeota archaeon]